MRKFLKKVVILSAIAGAVYGVMKYLKSHEDGADFDDFDDFDDDPEAELAEYLNDEAEQSEITEKAITAHGETSKDSREALKKAVLVSTDAAADTATGVVKSNDDVAVEEFKFDSLEK